MSETPKPLRSFVEEWPARYRSLEAKHGKICICSACVINLQWEKAAQALEAALDQWEAHVNDWAKVSANYEQECQALTAKVYHQGAKEAFDRVRQHILGPRGEK